MARYSAWQNNSIVEAVETLADTERVKPRGAFFGSIQGTLNHILWGDRIWMNRFAATEKPSMDSIPESINETDDWAEFCIERHAMDVAISAWSQSLDPAWLLGDLAWFSGAVNRNISKPKQTLVVHLFNHGTHHRGQIHAMLTAAGVTLADTDLPFMPD
ncbi:MAG: DinB family protein [Granulosicoccus sp.]